MKYANTYVSPEVRAAGARASAANEALLRTPGHEAPNRSLAWKVPFTVASLAAGPAISGALKGGGAVAGMGSKFGTAAPFGSAVNFGGGIAAAGSGAATGAKMAIPWGDIIKGVLSVGGQLIGAKTQANASNNAAKIQAGTDAAALAFAKEEAARAEASRLEANALEKARYDANEARLAPYRAMKDALARREAQRMGFSFAPSGGAPAASQSPWAPGASSGARTVGDLIGFSAPGRTVDQEEENPLVTPAPKLTIADVVGWGDRRRVA